MKNLKLAYKILTLSVVIILAFTIATGFVYSQTKTKLHASRADMVENAVDSVWGVVNHYAKLAENGSMSTAEAQQAAKEAVRATRYDGTNYFWINDTDAVMVMHPIKPELEGKNLASTKDPNGVALFAEMAKVAKNEGSGFVEYSWDKPGAKEPVEKISFVKLVPAWNWVVGTGTYLDDIQAEMDAIFYQVMSALVLAIAVVLTLVFFISRGITRPVAQTVEMIKRLRVGDFSGRLGMVRADEVGQLASALDAMADSLKANADVAEEIANGNLDVEVKLASDTDQLGLALQKMTFNLNDILSQIQGAGEQINSGSTQVADTSQSLSQGATEQAASLEEISASLNEMTSQTSMNAENANQANQLTGDAQQAAQKGSSQMQTMVAAMGEINEAGQNISKIIKTIDEIAFQTNLLALNAAVEAARAGQHGKGFAVVAEEVRNLAARSAKAAAETADLIEGSVEKTKNGSLIANQTADALAGIVGGITKVSDLVGEIAAASNEQAQGITQINQGVTQIDSVTQQNTANAEECAAAAEELSSQSEQLRQMLQRFTLKQGQHFQPSTNQAVPAPQVSIGWTNVAQAQHKSPAASPQIALDDREFGKY